MKPYYQDEYVTLYHADNREVLPQMSGARLVVTDPPYVFGIASTTQEGKAGGWGDMMNSAIWYSSWMNECKRITRCSGGAAWIFNSWRSFPVLARASHDSAWPISSLMVWDKEWIGPGGPVGLRPSYELCALFAQEGFQMKDRGLPDIWRSKWSSIKPSGHPAEKPVALLKRIISESGGGAVLDPFAGSCSTLVAAKALGLSAVGIEIEERYCEIGAKRLMQEVISFQEATA